MLKAIGAVLFHSEDPQRLVRFYREVMGLEASFGGEDGAEFRVGDVRIGLWQHSAIHGPASDPDRVIVNFLVEDVIAEYERLRETGVNFIKPPAEEARRMAWRCSAPPCRPAATRSTSGTPHRGACARTPAARRGTRRCPR